jgi:hypothetical protein
VPGVDRDLLVAGFRRVYLDAEATTWAAAYEEYKAACQWLVDLPQDQHQALTDNWFRYLQDNWLCDKWRPLLMAYVRNTVARLNQHDQCCGAALERHQKRVAEGLACAQLHPRDATTLWAPAEPRSHRHLPGRSAAATGGGGASSS